jgi:hypothetical protein
VLAKGDTESETPSATIFPEAMTNDRMKSGSTDQPVWKQGRVAPAVKSVKHHEECPVLEDHVDRPDKQKQPQDPATAIGIAARFFESLNEI